MLTEWEAHEIPDGAVPDMHPRHAPHQLFRPDVLNVRRDADTGQIIIAKIGGPAVFNGAVNWGYNCGWEWDRTRDDSEPWIDALLAWADEAPHPRPARPGARSWKSPL
ncbi:MAG: hypothetical protein WAV90_05685 [Gordonia amarae]